MTIEVLYTAEPNSIAKFHFFSWTNTPYPPEFIIASFFFFSSFVWVFVVPIAKYFHNLPWCLNTILHIWNEWGHPSDSCFSMKMPLLELQFGWSSLACVVAGTLGLILECPSWVPCFLHSVSFSFLPISGEPQLSVVFEKNTWEIKLWGIACVKMCSFYLHI